MSTIDDLKRLVDPATPPELSDADLQAVLDASLIPDEAGVWPGRPGYTTTHDLHWAAAEACMLRAIRAASQRTENITRIQSEGSSFQVETSGPDWAGLARYWRKHSRIGAEIGFGETLSVVELPKHEPPLVPASKALGQT